MCNSAKNTAKNILELTRTKISTLQELTEQLAVLLGLPDKEDKEKALLASKAHLQEELDSGLPTSTSKAPIAVEPYIILAISYAGVEVYTHTRVPHRIHEVICPKGSLLAVLDTRTNHLIASRTYIEDGLTLRDLNIVLKYVQQGATLLKLEGKSYFIYPCLSAMQINKLFSTEDKLAECKAVLAKGQPST